jgi:hypothetical protein
LKGNEEGEMAKELAKELRTGKSVGKRIAPVSVANLAAKEGGKC